jgi:hypothetical protein
VLIVSNSTDMLGISFRVRPMPDGYVSR